MKPLVSLQLPIFLALHNLINFASRKTRTRPVYARVRTVYSDTRDYPLSHCPGLINSFPILN